MNRTPVLIIAGVSCCLPVLLAILTFDSLNESRAAQKHSEATHGWPREGGAAQDFPTQAEQARSLFDGQYRVVNNDEEIRELLLSLARAGIIQTGSNGRPEFVGIRESPYGPSRGK